ncbi:MAG: hypothetical protein V4591_02955 [Bdellovibrionota bacterium]
MKHNKIRVLSFAFFLFYCASALAVPFTFLNSSSGNENDVDWYLLQSQNVQIYYDKNAYGMGRYALSSVQEAYPYLSALLGVKIGESSSHLSLFDNYLVSNYSNIVLVLGDREESAGFANPVTLNIESQMIHPRGASFFQHELVHRLMYEHFDYHIGAPGRLFSLAMLPTWWIEGLAEHFTESVGRVETDALIRSMALQDYWPTWEQLHALYNADGDTNSRGYATSGRFLGWIFAHSKEKNLYKIHEQLASKTVTPFFYSASDNWLQKNLNHTGEELYKYFKETQKKQWKSYLNGMPKLIDAKVGEPLFSDEYTYKTYTNKKDSLISKMTFHTNMKKSAFTVNVGSDKVKNIRRPISVAGSSLIAVENENNSLFVTSNLSLFSNSSYGNNLVVVKFKGNIFKLEDKNILSKKIIPFATEKNPFIIQEIRSAGNGGFFINANLRGNSFVYFLDVNTSSLRKVIEYEFPAYPKFISATNANGYCIYSIINWDKEQTSIEKNCANSTRVGILAKNKLNILDGYALKNNIFRLTVSWDKLLSIVDLNLNSQQIIPVAAFPDWMQGISGWDDAGKIFTAWVYEKGLYKLYKFDFEKLKNNYAVWLSRSNKNQVFTRPAYKLYEAPFKKLYALAAPRDVAMTSTTLTQNDNAQPQKISNAPALYDHRFMFAFPYALPDVLGGPSVNLVAIPYQDKMERDAVQIFGGYNFYLEAPSGTVSYINNRLLDGFVASLFAAPFFNGTYYKYKNGELHENYNYLLQEGVSLANLIKFKPSSLSLQQVFSVAQLQPYNQLDTAPDYVGPQNTTLVGLTEKLNFNLFTHGFYLADDDDPTGKDMVWKTDASVGGGKFNSLDGSTNSQGQATGDLDYYNLNSAFSSALFFNKQSITLAGRISTTQGSDTFNLREYYSPYQTYILGSTQSLNYVSYPVLATASLFDLSMGYWSGQTSLTYKFPIFKNAESLFLMAYVSDWNMFLSMNEGGTSPNKDGSNFNNLTTASIGTEFTLDIKGFQLYPSLSYSQLIEKAGWGVIMQVKMMDFM